MGWVIALAEKGDPAAVTPAGEKENQQRAAFPREIFFYLKKRIPRERDLHLAL